MTMKAFPLLCTVVLMSSMASGQPRVIPGAVAGAPESTAVEVGGLIYLSGSGGAAADAGADVAAQTTGALEQFRSTLGQLGLGLENLVSVNVYLADARHYQEMNQAYRQAFPGRFPARATVEAGLGGPSDRVKISAVGSRHRVEAVTPAGWPEPTAPYSWGALAGDHLFVSGMVGTDPLSGVAREGVEAQTRQTFENVLAVVRQNGMTPEDVVSVKVYLADARDFPIMNQVFRDYFPTAPPVRATIQARLADPRLRIEAQAVAVSGEKSRSLCGASSSQAFSSAVKVGSSLHLAGMLGHRRGMYAPHPGGQTLDTLENLAACSKEFGADLSRAVDASVYISDPRNQPKVDEAYLRVLAAPFPARTTVAAPLMSPDALVEIALILHLP